MASSTDQHGGRIEVRTIRTTTRLNHYLDWPKVGQVCRVERVVKCGAEQRRGVGYAITSAGPEGAGAGGLLGGLGGHSGIENRPDLGRGGDLGQERQPDRTRGG